MSDPRCTCPPLWDATEERLVPRPPSVPHREGCPEGVEHTPVVVGLDTAASFLIARADWLSVWIVESKPGQHEVMLRLDGSYADRADAAAVATYMARWINELGDTGTLRIVEQPLEPRRSRRPACPVCFHDEHTGFCATPFVASNPDNLCSCRGTLQEHGGEYAAIR